MTDNFVQNITIFVVDDAPAIRESLAGVLGDEGYEVCSFPDARSFFNELETTEPSLVLLDIWLPGTDGMAVLGQVRRIHPDLPVIMMSGHAGIETAVNAIKMGAADFLEKPLHLDVLVDKIAELLKQYKRLRAPLAQDAQPVAAQDSDDIRPGAAELVEGGRHQCTLRGNVVLNGTGLLTGRKTGIIVSPLDPNSGIVFQALDGTAIPGHITALENPAKGTSGQVFTANSTALVHNNRHIRTVEHLMAALSMAGISNVLIKSDEEVPNIDGSATDFCRMIEEAGVVEQNVMRREVVIRDRIQVGIEDPDEKYLYVEPFDGFEVRMRVNYPAPIFEQEYTFNAATGSFDKEIAPARSFNTFENIDMAQKMGMVGSGYLNSHIIIHDGKVINTSLRFPDEFVRHKILDLIGDLLLVGYPVQGRVVANMTSHGYNQALARKIHLALHGR
ncbi:MAG: UDP-3-O-acyl-N-acetylglucosamine deacetylase [Desulfobacterales bacterium]|nr:UDP-3-O-acyl-N-acetylglucosamine deacetylase [Desulfobacterales bacterium]